MSMIDKINFEDHKTVEIYINSRGCFDLICEYKFYNITQGTKSRYKVVDLHLLSHGELLLTFTDVIKNHEWDTHDQIVAKCYGGYDIPWKDLLFIQFVLEN